MNIQQPIYTEKGECQDCYKCVRNCPVKAIKVDKGCASVVTELCVTCGICVEVCPNSVKRIRDDVPRARQLISLRKRVLVSLAPSYVSEFSEGKPGQLIRGLKQLGFWGVSETALGAQEVSAHVAQMMRSHPHQPLISSACPVAVDYLAKYHPKQAALCTGLHSPALAHAMLLRRVFGEEIGVVFVGPCIAKKSEADANPDLINVALTFGDLRIWFDQAKIRWTDLEETPEDRFVPEEASEGALYPVDGGMIAGVKANCQVNDAAYMAISGIWNIKQGLLGIEELQPENGLLIELMACEGGCVAGPGTTRQAGTACKRYRVLTHANYPAEQIPRQPDVAIAISAISTPIATSNYSDLKLSNILCTVGKYSFEDERNCGGCGYDTCRAFARALLDQKAERSMCVTYMRQLALNKANALLRAMPSAVAIVDQRLTLLECNAHFVRMFAPDLDPTDAMRLEGARMHRLVPFSNLFYSVLKTGEDILDVDLRHEKTILHGSIFTIEKHAVVGGVFQDVTRPAVQKEQIVRKAREVIQKNLSTVQQIAYLLGENAAESEITLQSIIESFSPRVEDGKNLPVRPVREEDDDG